MRNSVKSLAGLAIAVCLLVGCQAVTGRTVGQNIDDSNLTAAVKTQLARDKISTLTRIDVDSNGGVVSLNGTVESGEQKVRAEQITRGVSGVRRVINNLQIQR
ncbi:MAG: BON domain-containing protein [Deltaproteobacteria bacterium]|nr:BON domain-containing protein [Deltaproteobacteria bacterium]